MIIHNMLKEKNPHLTLESFTEFMTRIGIEQDKMAWRMVLVGATQQGKAKIKSGKIIDPDALENKLTKKALEGI